jgi:ABC-2 type transport system ATP-binding protein
MIEVRGFSKVYEQQLAVDDLHFEVGPGEILGLVGPNGAGKTTTLTALAGILPPTSGVLSIAGFDVVKQPIEAKRHLSIIPDQPNLFEGLTVWEHLEFTAKVYGLRDWRARADELLAEVELTEQGDKLGDQLSHGMRQKVVLCCALLHEPRALLLDEPLSGLDPHGIRSLYRGLERRAADGAAVILSSHLLGQIEGFCTRFLILREGRRLFYGSKDEIRDEQADGTTR